MDTNNNNNNNNNNNSNNSNGKHTDELDPKPTVEAIQQALFALYGTNAEASVRDFAQNWLIKVQQLPQAWEFSPKLILESTVVELQYFGASTLENKLKKEWHSLQAESKRSVWKMIIELTQHCSKFTGIVATRMCVVLSFTTMYTYTSIWPNPIENVIQLVSPHLDTDPLQDIKVDRLRFVLEYLSILPMELNNETLACRYKELDKAIRLVIDKIHKFLITILLSLVKSGQQAQYRAEIKVIYKSFAEWLRYMLPSPETLLTTFDTCLEIAYKDTTLIESMMYLIDRSLRHLETRLSPEMEKAYSVIANRVQLVMPEFYHRAISEQNQQNAKAIVSLFVQIMSNNNSTVLSKEMISRYMELLVGFINVGDRQICEHIFPLLEDFKGIPEVMSLSKQVLENFFLQVLNRVKDLASYPISGEKLDSDEAQELHTFRIAAKDAFATVQSYILSDRLLFINTLINLLRTNISNSNPHWQPYEVCLYLISTLSEPLHAQDYGFVPLLLQVIPNIQCKSLELVKTSIKLFGRYSGFLKDNKEHLEKVIFDLIPAFQSPDLLPVAANSFLNITTNNKCSTLLVPHVSQILDLCAPYLVSNQNISAITIVYDALLHIIHVIPPDKLMGPFQKLLTPIIQNINQVIQTKSTKSSQFLKIQLSILQHTTKVIDVDEANENKQHPLFPFLQAIVPLLKSLLEMYSTDCEIIDSIANIYRWTILFCKNIVADFVPEILIQVTEAYMKYPLASLLQAISAVGSSYNHKMPVEIETKYKSAISLVSNTTLTLLKNETTNLLATRPPEYTVDPQYMLSFSIRPDLTKDYLLLIQSSFNNSPQCIDTNIISVLLVYLIHNILDTKDVNTSRGFFTLLSVIVLVNKSKDKRHEPFVNIVNDLMMVHGKVLITNLLAGVAGSFPQALLYNTSDLFHAYSSAYPTPFRREAKKILIDAPFLNDTISPCDKQIFLSQLQRVDENKADYRFAIMTFSILCKGK